MVAVTVIPAKCLPPRKRGDERNLSRWAFFNGLLDAALLVRYEGTMRPEGARSAGWTAGQMEKVHSGLAAIEAGAPAWGDAFDIGKITLACALGYLDFLQLMASSAVVLTDSGGVQEETTILGVPCVTLRDNTERPITVEMGTNRLTGTDPGRILAAVDDVLAGRWKTGSIPPLWDGRAAERMVGFLSQWRP